MGEQVGPRGLWKQIRHEAPMWAKTLPQIPRLIHEVLNDDAPGRLEKAIGELERAQRRARERGVTLALER